MQPVEMDGTQQLLVSVVVPTYNRANLVIEACESIQSQSYRPIEVIVVDDGSTDETGAAVRKFASAIGDDPNFSLRYVKQEKAGGNPARNRGIIEARGEFVAFLDSDDLWHASKLAKQMPLFESGSRKVGAVYCGLRHVDLLTGKLIHDARRDYPTGNLLESLLIKDVTCPTSTYIVRKEVFDQVGLFDERLLARQDWDMWIRVASAFEIECVPESLVDFRDHAGPRTFTDPTREIVAYAEILKKYQHLHERFGWRIRRQIWASYYRRMARVYSHRNISRIKAVGFAIQAIGYWPLAFDSYAALVGIFLPRNFRAKANRCWNRVFGTTRLGIRSH